MWVSEWAGGWVSGLVQCIRKNKYTTGVGEQKSRHRPVRKATNLQKVSSALAGPTCPHALVNEIIASDVKNIRREIDDVDDSPMAKVACGSAANILILSEKTPATARLTE